MTLPAPPHATLRALATVGIDACEAHFPQQPLADPEWQPLCGAVSAARLEGAMAAAVDCGLLPTTQAQFAHAGELHRSAMSLALLLEREMLETVRDLDRAGVGSRVLKGPAIAHLDEADPARRAYGDVDILVPGRNIATAVEVMEARGGHRRYPQPRPGFDERFTKGISFAFDRNVEIDLHRTLSLGPFGLTIDTDELFASTECFTVGGVAVPALDRPGRFIHAAAHAVLGSSNPRLSALRDLALTAPRDRAETRETLARMQRWQLDAPVARAVAIAQAWLGWTPPTLLAAWIASADLNRRQRRWLASYEGTSRSSMRLAVGSIEALPGIRRRLAYAWAVAAPRKPAGGATHRWRRGIDGVRGIHRR